MIKSKKCTVEGCNNPVWSKGKCKNHTDNKKPLKRKALSTVSPSLQDLEERYKMIEFFDKLWDKQKKPRRCQSCGKKIIGENLSIYHDHLLEKEFWPQFIYEERNMFFCCAECHDLKTRGFITPKHKEALEKAKKELLKL